MEPPSTPAVRDYDDIADGYDEFVKSSTIHGVALGALLPLCTPSGQVLDLGCGQGVLARELAARGNTVVAIDIAERLLALARRQEKLEPRGITYRHADAATLAGFADASFAGVATSLTFTDIADLQGVLRSVVRVLAPGGWFAFATLHPCFEPPHARTVEVDGRFAKQVNAYFEEGSWSRNPDSLIGTRYHRRVATILNTVLEAGLVIERTDEPRGDPTAIEQSPIYGEVAEVLVARAIKPARRVSPR